MTQERYKELVASHSEEKTDAENKMHLYYMGKSIQHVLLLLVVLEVINLFIRRRA